MKYRIKWTDGNGRTGVGSFLFLKSEAEEICRGLNFDYPEVHYEPVPSVLEEEQETEYGPH